MNKNNFLIDKASNPNFAELEVKIIEYWKRNSIFEKSIEQRSGQGSSEMSDKNQVPTPGYKNKEFVFYDGPPFANGLPHYGHLLTGYVKDVFARYQTMKGYKVERKLGWDCHGLPAEMAAEKELGVQGSKAINEYGVDKFNEYCATSVMQYAEDWKNYIIRQGRWVDMENSYKTMDLKFSESVLWAFKTLYQKGLLYEDYRVMPYSWAAETPLSNFETRLDNSYREKKSKAVTVAFKLLDVPAKLPSDIKDLNLMVWTTTPWTLPSNLAIAVGLDIGYNVVKKDNKHYVIAENLVHKYEDVLSDSKGEVDFVESKPYQLTEDREWIFETPRLLVREVTQADLDFIYQMQQDPDVRRFLNHDGSFMGSMEHLSFLLACYRNDGFGQWAMIEKETGLMVGIAGPFWFDKTQDALTLGYVFQQSAWGKGYATEIAKASRNWVFDTMPEVSELLCFAKPGNGDSMHIMKKIGMTYKGTNEIYVPNIREDKIEVCYSITRENFEKKNDSRFIIKGKDLVGKKYQPLFEYFSNIETAFQILDADFVTTEDGTGIVHMAPGFGEDDQLLCKERGIPTICPVDQSGKFTNDLYDLKNSQDDEILELKGKQVFECNDEIIKFLKKEGYWLKTEQYLHNYPHCWRTDTPLIYKAMSSWYVKVTDFKDRMVELNQQINWIPGHIKDGLFGKWIANARDWSISRNRFWGCPVPVWKSNNPKYPRIDVYGSIAELEEDFDVKITDLHKPFIDSLVRKNPDDPTGESLMIRVSDVLDCWFESGSMPYAQTHYPFENREWFEENFPADFIVEYSAQTRGWFYTMMVLSVAIFDKVPFLNCVCHGNILDENSQKLSKRLQNYPDPFDMFNKYGSDALRFSMLSSFIMKGNELNVDREGDFIKDALKISIKPIWNSYNFFVLYARVDNIILRSDILGSMKESENIMDQYILLKLKVFIEEFSGFMDAYDTVNACKLIDNIFDVLNNWYIRRNRERFWRESNEIDKMKAYETLYVVLISIVKSIAPLLPFIAEEIFQGLLSFCEDAKDLTTGKQNESVHLCDYPATDFIITEKREFLVEEMDFVRDICNVGLSLRHLNKARIRMPLKSVTIIGHNVEMIQSYSTIINDELNVKETKIDSNLSDYAENKLKLNFKSLGKKLGKDMKLVSQKLNEGKWSLLDNNRLKIDGFIIEQEDFSLNLIPKKPEISAPLSTNDTILLLDTELDENLIQEGIARDFIRFVQKNRKDRDFHITDKINVQICTTHQSLIEALQLNETLIAGQILANNISYVSDINARNIDSVSVQIEEMQLSFYITNETKL